MFFLGLIIYPKKYIKLISPFKPLINLQFFTDPPFS